MLKRLLTLTVALLLALPTLALAPLTASGEEAPDLWQMKDAFDATDDFYPYRYYVHPALSNWPFVLLYVEGIGVELRMATQEEKEFAVGVVGGYVIVYDEYVSFCKSTMLDEVETGRFLDCALLHLVRALDVSKEQLIDANEKMRTDPKAIRPLFTMFTDVEFDAFYERIKKDIEDSVLPQFFIEALCTEDFVEAQNLLCTRGVFLEDGTYITNLFGDGRDLEVEGVDNRYFSVEDLISGGIQTTAFRRYLSSTYGVWEKGWVGEYGYDSVQMEAKWEKLNAYLTEHPPQTGDPTAAYALVFTLAALPLAGLGVHEWKKRRRAM